MHELVRALLHLPGWIHMSISLHLCKHWHESKRQMAGGRETVARRRKDREARQTSTLAGWHGYTSLLYGLDQADEGWGSRLWRCELLAQVRHRNSWNNNTNHCYNSGTKPLKGHRGAAALTRAQLTRSSWRCRACVMWWEYIKSARNTIKYGEFEGPFRKRHTCFAKKEEQQFDKSSNKK